MDVFTSTTLPRRKLRHGKVNSPAHIHLVVNEGAQTNLNCLVQDFLLVPTPLHALNVVGIMLGASQSHQTYSSKQFPFDQFEETKAGRHKFAKIIQIISYIIKIWSFWFQ